MAMERRDPLPPGRYSLFVPVADGAAWKAWTKEHASTIATVAAVPQKALASNTPFFATSLDGDIIENLIGTLVLFDVSDPTPWVRLGFPDIVPGPQTPAAALEWAGKEAESKAIPDPSADVWSRIQGLIFMAAGVYVAAAFLTRPRHEGKAS